MMPAALGLFALAVQVASDPALVAEVRSAPLATREAVAEALREGDLLAARRLASAHAEVWRDSFLVREVDRFAGWSSEQRAGKLAADSLRRAGNDAYGREGAPAAIAIWHEALARARGVGDSALAAAVAGNIGTGLLREGRLDSAEVYLNRAAGMARRVGDRRVEANAVTALGAMNEAAADPEGARAHYVRALSLHERIGDTRGVAADLNNLGLLARGAGDLAEARRQFEAALAINRRAGRDEVAATNLVNLAGVASLEGDFDRAQGLYGDALATWRRLDRRADAADALHGIGQLELRRGDYRAARAALEEALAIYRQTGPPASELAVRRALAGALAAQGDMQGALDAVRAAEDAAASRTVAPDVRAGIALAGADLAVQLNALGEAERLYSRAEQLYRAAGRPAGQAQAQHGRALLLLASEDFAGAEAILDAALRIQRAEGDQRSAGIVRIALGQAAKGRGDTARARRQFSEAAAELELRGDPVGVAAALGELAGLEAERGLPASAEALYGRALEALAGRDVPDLAWRLHAGLAAARQARGSEGDASSALRLAIAEVERVGRSLAVPERRAGFLADKWDVYARLALLERAGGRPEAAFEVSERLRAGEMLELLDRGRIRPPEGPDGALVAREQDLRRQIHELTTRLEGGATGSLRGRAPIADADVVREALLAAQAGYAGLLREMEERAPRHAQLVSRRPAGWRDLARRLRGGEAFVEYLIGESGSVAFLVSRDTLAVVDLGIGRRDLARLVAFARGTVEVPGTHSDSLWRGPFRRLHRHLIAPVEATGLLEGIERLVLVPHAELHYLPFAALLGDRGPLVERYDLATTPSATVWLALGERPARRPRGILAMAPRPDALPGSGREVRAVARLAADGAEVLVGRPATESAFRESAAGKRVLHLSTYGILNQHNPLFSFVELAPQDQRDGDGRLEVHEVFGLQIDADLVVLSACQTGLASGRLADVPTGDDWVGLTRAFLHAGARSVVATLWAVEDQPTATLMEEFYTVHETGAEPGRALAASQRTLRGRPETAHPFYWAGVALVEGR